MAACLIGIGAIDTATLGQSGQKDLHPLHPPSGLVSDAALYFAFLITMSLIVLVVLVDSFSSESVL